MFLQTSWLNANQQFLKRKIDSSNSSYLDIKDILQCLISFCFFFSCSGTNLLLERHFLCFSRKSCSTNIYFKIMSSANQNQITHRHKSVTLEQLINQICMFLHDLKILKLNFMNNYEKKDEILIKIDKNTL